MLIDKNQMNNEMNGRYRDGEEAREEMPRQKVTPNMFGEPDFGDESAHEEVSVNSPMFYDPNQVQNAYEQFNDVNSDNVGYENELEELYEDDEQYGEGSGDEQPMFTPPPPWQGVKDYPTPPSFRQPNGDFIREEPIFPGGPARTEVAAWKKQFEADNHEVHLSERSDGNFIWRTLSRTEYREILALPNTDPLQREEIICEVCVLFPYNYNFSSMAAKKAGTPAVIAEQIMHASGFEKPTPSIRL